LKRKWSQITSDLNILNWKSSYDVTYLYFVIYLYVFKLVCTRWEIFIRIGITVLYLKSCRCPGVGIKHTFQQLSSAYLQKCIHIRKESMCPRFYWPYINSNYLFYWLRFASPVKRHLPPPNPQLTPPTLQIQYCYSLIRTSTDIYYKLIWSRNIHNHSFLV
jgi:hypothetical protein